MNTVFRHCKLIDGTKNTRLIDDMKVTVDGEIITAVENDDDSPLQKGHINLSGKYLMPGLINLHVHIPASGIPKKKPTDNKKLVKLIMANGLTKKIGVILGKKYAKVELLSGVTTLRAVGGVAYFDTLLRDKINAGKAVGPRILAANSAIATEGGHMTGTVAVEAYSVEDCVKLVDERHAQGVDHIKLMITGGVLDATVKGEPGVLKMSPEFVKAACDEAHRLGLKVAAHVESPEGVKVALENGVDTIEHGALLDDGMVELFKKHNAALVCTISPAYPLARFETELLDANEMVRFNAEVVLNGIIEAAKTCLNSGVPVGLGTDTGCPFVTHYSMWRELDYFKKYCGVTSEFALYTATLKNAEIVGIDKETGSIEVGKSADMLIVEENPLDDFAALANPYMVVMRGKTYNSPKNKKSEVCETMLDKYRPQ